MQLALITGGTSGIGLEFARALARDGVNLVLVARDPARLDAVAAGLSGTFGVAVETLAADLASRDDQERVAGRLRAGDIDVLVNNAGFSLKNPLAGGDDALADRAYEVMGRAPRVLAGAAASVMRDAGRGWILNIVSVSALTRQDSYSALKAYALALSEVLALELVGTGVQVTAVLPGWTRTEFHDRGRSKRSKVPGFLWLSPARVAADGLRDARAGRVISIPSKRYKLIAAILHALPAGAVRALSRKVKGSRPAPNSQEDHR
ncbi:MAG: SDR family NAD(P)-dependent oxidoreductase [Propioniciclava sp.]|uniref:SDR family NAD(P)-dependent oxidoreductase n=1 Tax=Propioniciclava sp. TaxID=2038686 RepID=UPI0039E37B02